MTQARLGQALGLQPAPPRRASRCRILAPSRRATAASRSQTAVAWKRPRVNAIDESARLRARNQRDLARTAVRSSLTSAANQSVLHHHTDGLPPAPSSVV